MKDKCVDAQESCPRIARGLYMGQLMSPQEVARAVAGRTGPDFEGLQRWTLCGDVPPEIFWALKAQGRSIPFAERLTAFSSKGGNNYAILTHQLGSFQHRFLVPLYDPKVFECLEDITGKGSLGYSIGGEGDDAMVMKSNMEAKAFIPLKALTSVSGDEWERIVDEYATVLRQVHEPARVPSAARDVEVRHVSVSFIPPTSVLQRVVAQKGGSK